MCWVWPTVAMLLAICSSCTHCTPADARLVAGRHIMQQLPGNASSTAQFSAEALYAQLQLDVQSVASDPPSEEYTIESEAVDVQRVLEDPETNTRSIMIQPGVRIIVLEGLSVPESTVNSMYLQQAALDLRTAGLDSRIFLTCVSGIVILPFQLKESAGDSLPRHWVFQDSHILTPCQGDVPNWHLDFSNLASSGYTSLKLTVRNSTVRCLSEGHINEFVEYLQVLPVAVVEGSPEEESTVWVLPLIITSAARQFIYFFQSCLTLLFWIQTKHSITQSVSAVCLVMAIVVLHVYLCCCRYTCSCKRQVKLYVDEEGMFPPPPASDHQHKRMKELRSSLSGDMCRSAAGSLTGGWETLEIDSQTGRHSGTSPEAAPDIAACSPGRPRSAQFDVDLRHIKRNPLSHNDCGRSLGSVSASTPRFIGSKAAPMAPLSSPTRPMTSPRCIATTIDRLTWGEASDGMLHHSPEEQRAAATARRYSGTIDSRHPALNCSPPRHTAAGSRSADSKPKASISRVSANHTIVSGPVSSPQMHRGQDAGLRSNPVEPPIYSRTQEKRAQQTQLPLQQQQQHSDAREAISPRPSGGTAAAASTHSPSTPAPTVAAVHEVPTPPGGVAQFTDPTVHRPRCTGQSSGAEEVPNCEPVMDSKGQDREDSHDYAVGFGPLEMLTTLPSIPEELGRDEFPSMPTFDTLGEIGSQMGATDTLMDATGGLSQVAAMLGRMPLSGGHNEQEPFVEQ